MISYKLMLRVVPRMLLKIIQYIIYKVSNPFTIINIKVMRSIWGTTLNINEEVRL